MTSQDMNIFLMENELKPVKVGKNQIYRDGEFFVVEKYEFTNDETDMFSIIDAYSTFEKALEVAKTYQGMFCPHCDADLTEVGVFTLADLIFRHNPKTGLFEFSQAEHSERYDYEYACNECGEALDSDIIEDLGIYFPNLSECY